jgi:predicted nucleic acid-binding protein
MDASRLAAFPVFAGLPAAEHDEVAAAVREVEVDADSTVTTLDDYGAAIFFEATRCYRPARSTPRLRSERSERVARINSLKVRFLGDKVLQRTAWRVADQLGWETTFDAEYVALTQLQADAFVTSDSDLARAVSGLVTTATIDALRTA